MQIDSLASFRKVLRDRCDFWSVDNKDYDYNLFDFLNENKKMSRDAKDYKNEKPLKYEDLQFLNSGSARQYIVMDLDKHHTLVEKSLKLQTILFLEPNDLHTNFELYKPVLVPKNAPTSHLDKDQYRDYLDRLHKNLESEKTQYKQKYEQLKDMLENEYNWRVAELERDYTSNRKLLAMIKIRPSMRKSLKTNLDELKEKFISGPYSPASVRPNLDFDEQKKPTLHDNYPGGSEIRAAKKRFDARKTQKSSK